jgi:predicted MPP superfamily phosphohydrolase
MQCFITAMVLRLAARKFQGRALTLAKWGVLLFNVVVVVGIAMSFSEVVERLGIPGRPALLVGAATLAYFFGTGSFLLIRGASSVIRKRLHVDVDPGRRRLLQLGANAAMAAPFAALGYGAFIQRTDFRVREIDLRAPGLPADLDGLRVLQLSDIHLSAFLSEAEFARAIDAALELRPQLAVVTGDLISFQGDPLDACIRQLGRLKADAGVFGCLGNHERYAHAEDYAERAAARYGIRFLRSQAQPLRFGSATLNLAGVDHQTKSHGRSYLVGAERLVNPAAYNLLLSHNPDVLPVAAEKGFQAMLAGHTHGGQVNVEILDQGINPARFFTPFVYGLYRVQSTSAYVTRGIGTIGVPARLGAPPEIPLLRLRKA